MRRRALSLLPLVPLAVLLLVMLAGSGTLFLAAPNQPAATAYLGFDRNLYPGDDALPVLRETFSFASYWLGPAPGEKVNTWRGKRELLRSKGFGFVVLYRGRLGNEIKTAAQAERKGLLDARTAADAARAEGFAPQTILFLDIEEGGRLSAAYHAYIRVWVDELTRLAFRAGVYCSGIPVDEGSGVTIRTADDVRDNADAREITYWVFNDVCPPSPGCGAPQNPPPVSASGVSYASLWQFVRSPRSKEFTARCAATYAPDGNCYAPNDVAHAWHLDVNSAISPDPSGGARGP